MNYRNLKGNKIWVTEALRPSLLKTPAEAEGSGSQCGPTVARVRHPLPKAQKGTVQKLTCCFLLAPGPSPSVGASSEQRLDLTSD